MFRTLVEKAGRQVVFKRRLPARYGSRAIYVSPEGGLRYWRPTLQHIDDNLFQLIDTFIRPGDTVWDIGANLGLFLFAAAHRTGLTGRSLAIEPDVWLVSVLHKSARLNPDLTIDVLPFAVADQVGLSRLNIASRARSTNFLAAVQGSTQTGGVRHSQLVPVSTLDTLLEQYGDPNFVKIDVETAEHLVMRGATRLLTTARPALYCEIAEENSREIREILLKADYRLFDGDDPSFKSVSEPAYNTLALPAEHWFLPQS